jgi:nucleotide-binding universal stress UspA family protein
MFDNIIIGVDGRETGRDALGLAKQLASQERQVTLAYVQVLPVKPPPDTGDRAYDRRRAAERLASLGDESHVDADVLCVEARSVAAGLHDLAVRRDADLLVIGASRSDELDRVFVGDDTRSVLEQAPCAVAVAPTGYAARPQALETIGAAYDGSPESRRALAVARKLARERNAELSAFEAVREPLSVQDPWDPQPEIDEGLAKTREGIAELGDVEPHAASGDAIEELTRYGASVDLLVVGSHQYGPIDHLRPGSTAQRLADNAPCPLLVLA